MFVRVSLSHFFSSSSSSSSPLDREWSNYGRALINVCRAKVRHFTLSSHFLGPTTTTATHFLFFLLCIEPLVRHFLPLEKKVTGRRKCFFFVLFWHAINNNKKLAFLSAAASHRHHIRRRRMNRNNKNGGETSEQSDRSIEKMCVEDR